MRKLRVVLLIFLFLTSSVATVSAKDASGVRFSGSYDWTDGGSDDLTAEFKPDGEGSWNGRTWEFEATIEQGVLKGTHTEIKTGSTRYRTGTFEMQR